jgi:glutamate/tyrosine decarboxylase-like PLP-dependent enzyme
MNLVGIRPVEGTAAELARALRERGWAVGEFAEHVRVVVLPHLDDEHLTSFAAALAECRGAKARVGRRREVG